MGDFSRNEREAAELLKKLNFSRYSKAHKNKLWESLTARSVARLLDDDELDMAAGGVRHEPEEPEKPEKP